MTQRLARSAGWAVVLVLFAIAGLLVLRDYHAFRQEALASPVGKNAPDAAVMGMSGKPLRLSSFGGRPLWLNFFATWCAPCKVEMPQIERRSQRLKKAKLLVVGVDQQETPALVARFVGRLALTFPMVIDNGPAAASYAVFDLPTSVFIDSRGVIQAVHVGEMAPKDMDADLSRILPTP